MFQSPRYLSLAILLHSGSLGGKDLVNHDLICLARYETLRPNILKIAKKWGRPQYGHVTNLANGSLNDRKIKTGDKATKHKARTNGELPGCF